MKANSYSITRYSLEELDWFELWDIYHGLELALKESSPHVHELRVRNIMDEILRISDTEKNEPNKG